MDYVKGTTKGFAFVEFEEAEDAEEAIFNRNGATLLGRTLQVSLAQANQAKKISEPVWNSDDWFQKQQQAGEEQQATEATVAGKE